MKGITVSWSGLASFLRQAVAVAGLVVAVTNTDSLPSSVRSSIVLISGALLTAQHYAQAQASNTTTTTITTAAPTTKGTP